ncbi:hypothetical protein FDW83_00285 [Pseudarthrobacter sp. NamE2]|uniref:hypothetical protein n=1 Tax=Pseudarthrobacter sp. NamE2 TaxID=2576838 RepID=UPI0010FE0CC3|nr:hypothetical protein [Pseudarthrobacter sp. NamE2]TLM86245.1 hypothetical protein FDW83_00285 [Pseudarthrobacter sp. NamE2]
MIRPQPGPATPDQDSGKRLRRRLLLWSALPVLLLVGMAAKLLSLGLLANQADTAFKAGDAAAVERAAGGLSLANVIERHKAPFAAGDAEALAGNYPAARLLFEEALAAVPSGSGDECSIRVNLSLAIEKLGDEKQGAEEPSSAASLYAEALAVVDTAPPRCSSGDTAAGSGKTLREAEQRLNSKLVAAAEFEETPGEASQDEASEEQEPLQQSQLEQLEENARQAERERNAGREREDYLNDTDYPAGPDRPW